MANIKVADSVILSKANTPLDARCRVATEAVPEWKDTQQKKNKAVY